MRRREFLASTMALAAPGHSRLVYPGPGGKLVYAADADGNRIPDFSNCGYLGGGAALPEVPVRAEVRPAAGDSTARIQAAIDKVSGMAPGERGAVLLARGSYQVGGSLRIAASGVVLRGAGSGENGATLTAAGRKQRALIEIRGGAARAAGSGAPIVDDYVPVGARSFRIKPASAFRPGQTVIVRRIGNAAWIREIGMDRIKPRPDNPASTRQWQPFNLEFERVVTGVDGDRIVVDAPITCAIETRWGGGEVLTFDESGRIANCGVENLRGVSEFDPAVTALYGRDREKYHSDEAHAWSFLSIDSAVNVWARNLAALYFGYACVDVRRARWVTVRDCDCRRMVSVLTGSRRYPYSIGGQLCLVERCSADTARHDFAIGSRVCGPNVFLDCRAGKSYATSEPHHRWSVGGLFDNVKADIAIQDRQYYGTGHGWAGANYVAWNCEGRLVCQKPPTAQNWAIGHVGEKLPGAFAPREDGHWESFGRHVEPRSLYRQQLRDRAS